MKPMKGPGRDPLGGPEKKSDLGKGNPDHMGDNTDRPNLENSKKFGRKKV